MSRVALVFMWRRGNSDARDHADPHGGLMHELRTVFVCGIDQLFPEDRRHVAYVSVAIYSCMIPLNHSGLVLYNFD